MCVVIELQKPVRPVTGEFLRKLLFTFGGFIKCQNLFLTYTQQIDKLRNEKNLIIDDENSAIDTLHQIGYFKLIGGYKHLFKNKNDREIQRITHFEDIVALYTLTKHCVNSI